MIYLQQHTSCTRELWAVLQLEARPDPVSFTTLGMSPYPPKDDIRILPQHRIRACEVGTLHFIRCCKQDRPDSPHQHPRPLDNHTKWKPLSDGPLPALPSLEHHSHSYRTVVLTTNRKTTRMNWCDLGNLLCPHFLRLSFINHDKYLN